MKRKPAQIDPISQATLYVKPYANDVHLGNATAFVVVYKGEEFLVTNWHVLSGRDAETREALHSSLAIPNFLRAAHHVAGKPGQWMFYPHPLYAEDGSPLWIQHPRGHEVDVAALPLREQLDWAETHPIDFEELARTDMLIFPGLPVNVIGFPFGLRLNGLFPLWKTGHIASQTDLQKGGRLPCSLIDATTRQGMSGAPVVARQSGTFLNSDGIPCSAAGLATKLIGVYSSHLHNAEVGYVWWPEAVIELLDARAPGTSEL